MRYKNKIDSSIVEATQWFKNGDHPKDQVVKTRSIVGREWNSEGLIVGYYKTAQGLGLNKCQKCNHIMNHHGLLCLHESIVCPTDWIITSKNSFYYNIPDKIFKENYEQC